MSIKHSSPYRVCVPMHVCHPRMIVSGIQRRLSLREAKSLDSRLRHAGMTIATNSFGTRFLRFGIILIVVVMLFCCSERAVCADGTGGQAGAYLKLGMDARAKGLGSAYTAIVNDAAAGYWNPGGLGLAQRQQLMAAYTAFPEGGDYSQIAYVLPLSEFAFPEDQRSGSSGGTALGSLGVTVLRYAAAYNIEARQIDSINPDYYFSNTEGCYGLSYGMLLSQALSVGLGVKGLYHELDQEDANGFGIDVGAIWRGFPGLSLGVAIRDVYSQLHWSTGYQEVFPVTVKAGAGYQRSFGKSHTLLVSVEATHNLTPALPGLHAGMEYGFEKLLFVRAGYDNGVLALGGGARIPWLGWEQAALVLDYSVQEDRIVGWDHWFSLKLEL
jgi:hypothetical protein